MTLRSPLLALPISAVLLGCSANVATSSEAADAEATPVTAVVTVDRTAQLDGVRSEVVARFVRALPGPVSDGALAMVGANLDLPSEGACTKLPMPAAASPASAIQLLDVGAVALDSDPSAPSADGADHTLELAPRRLPDVVDLVSGVVYTTRASETSTVPARGRFVLRVAGAPDLDIAPLAVDAITAGEPSDVRVAGIEPDANGVSLSASAPLEVSWTAGDGLGDVVYLDVSGRGVPTSRCAFSDAAGRAVLAPSALPPDEGTLTVHRVHRETFHAHGIDNGELRFDFARVVPVHRL